MTTIRSIRVNTTLQISEIQLIRGTRTIIQRNVHNHATPDRGQENVVDMIDVVNRGPRATGTGYFNADRAISRWKPTDIARRQKTAQNECRCPWSSHFSMATDFTIPKTRSALGPQRPCISKARGIKLWLFGLTRFSYTPRFALPHAFHHNAQRQIYVS